MTGFNIRGGLASASIKGLAICLAAWFMAPAPAAALSNGQQVLSGSITTGTPSTRFTSPGGSANVTTDFPNTGLGETAVQMSMPAGVLNQLRVNVTPNTAPSSGDLTVTVTINGSDTILTCTVTGAGTCKTKKNQKVTIKNNRKLAIRVDNDFVGTANVAITYTLLFD